MNELDQVNFMIGKCAPQIRPSPMQPAPPKLNHFNFSAAPFADYQIESNSDLLNWSVKGSRGNRIRTLPEGESRIEFVLPLGGNSGESRFAHVKVSER